MHGHTELAIVVLQAILPWLLSLCKNYKTLFFSSRDIDDQRIL